jgi:hypothetical protein
MKLVMAFGLLARTNELIRNIQPNKFTILFLRSLHYHITLTIPKCFDPRGIITREPNQSNTA